MVAGRSTHLYSSSTLSDTSMRSRFLLAAVGALVLGCTGGDDTPDGLISSITVSGGPESGAMSTGESSVVEARTYDQEGVLTLDVPVEWGSSNATVATVTSFEPGGHYATIVAVGPGRASIVASSDQARTTVRISVIVIPVARLAIEPDSSIGIVGMKQTYVAVLVDSLDRPLTDRTVTWSSLDPSIVRVNALGEALALQNGTARLKAVSEGKADTATVTVVPKTAGDWSGVTEEWTTYQGTGRHAGFVPATLDVTAFTRRWTVPPSTPPEALQTTSFGSGLLFATVRGNTNTTPKLMVFDPADGTRRWMRDFGNIHSATPPAYGNGNVFVATGGHGDSYMWSFDPLTGVARFQVPYGNQWTAAGSPVVEGFSVFLSNGYYGGTYAFSTIDGAVAWFTQTQWMEGVSPTVADGHVYVYINSVTALNATTGAEEYTINNSGSGTLVRGSLGNLVAAQATRLVSLDLVSRTTQWEVAGFFGGQPSVGDGMVYAQNDGSIEARRESDGGLVWFWKLPGTDPGPPRPMIATRNLLFVTNRSATYAVDLTAHLPVWWYPVGAELSLSQAGLLVISGDDGSLTGIRVK